MSGQLHVIAGAQFGSEGKGNVTAWRTRIALEMAKVTRHGHSSPLPISVRVGGPNAGHCVVDARGDKWALRTLPVGAVLDHESPLVIAEGSEIDPAVLLDELTRTEAAGYDTFARLTIDSRATVIEAIHTDAPEGRADTGRTGKGVGGARAARLRKTAKLWEQWVDSECDYGLCDLALVNTEPTAPFLREELRTRDIIIEGTQGYGLGTHTAYYPHVTSGDCRALDFINQAGLTIVEARHAEVWLVARVHPIRIAGPSGPLLGETTWDAVGVPPEFTTVTHKVRRVGRWDPELVRQAIDANGESHLVLTFFDYINPEAHGRHLIKRDAVIEAFEDTINHQIEYVGTSDTVIASVVD